MRVVHVVPRLFDEAGNLVGGAERYALELARHMADATPTRLLSFGRRASRFRLGQLDVKISSAPFLVHGQVNNPLSPAMVGALLGSDVIHAHQTYTLGHKLLAVCGRVLRKPVFTTDLGGGGWSLECALPARHCYTGHLHISEYSRRVYKQEGSTRARVILGGVDASRFIPGSGGSGVLYVGRVLPHKGVDYLIRALPDSIPLNIVGPETDRPYSDMLRLLAKGKLVSFRGILKGDVLLAREYAAADMVILPSVYRDCYGNQTKVPELLGQTLLEGMAAALPAVATHVASLPEVVEDGVTGLLVMPNDTAQLRAAILRLVRDTSTARKMGHAGRHRVLDRFTWKATVDRCFDAYATLGGVLWSNSPSRGARAT